ncbi:MAG: carbamoyl-phosphate synthase large subunit [Spirochaetaceae bacterium]|jgi:carbamoyl-phosphate synthase large subunit|nr:carbamoyl-phosphate synthase large subunit [Spirochaetaceae bacterium]
MDTTLKLPKKVLVLGSGGLKIGQAGEFDYSGSQALKALREEGVKTVLINPNIATIQTSMGMADRTYFLPVTPAFVRDVIEKERPDGLLLSFGGQTALNCGVELETEGILYKYGVKVLGTPVKAIQDTEDRQRFVDKLNEIGAKTPRSIAIESRKEEGGSRKEEKGSETINQPPTSYFLLPTSDENESYLGIEGAVRAAEAIGYPVMVRAAYALGGAGSGICKNEAELRRRCEAAFGGSPQVLVEEWLGGWKEIEYEVVRDRFDNCITVCNMENLDPLGIHTGESIVVAPSQTLNDNEYHKLRKIAIEVIRHIGIVGECNIQYALDPHSADENGELNYRIIEVNARLSRSSALASKATGYPLAFVAAKLALGYALTDIKNSITHVTKSCFEPALDYVVVKAPRWDLKKFKNVDTHIGSEMKSVGEVMSIGRTFEEALQKALRMTGVGAPGLSGSDALCGFEINREPRQPREQNIEKLLQQGLGQPTDRRIFLVYRAMQEGWTIDKIHKFTKIDKWFLYKIKNILDCQMAIQSASDFKNIKPATDAIRTVNALYGYTPEYSFFRTQVGAVVGGLTDKPEQTGKSALPSIYHHLTDLSTPLSQSLLQEAKTLGFSDAHIATLINLKESDIRSLREKYNIKPVVKQIDTLAAEYPAQTNYLYMTYSSNPPPTPPASGRGVLGEGKSISPPSGGGWGGDDIPPVETAGNNGSIMVLGSGAYRIGSSVEFDWCCVNAVQTARELGRTSIMVNCNPETVSTDYDICDRLYFEELTLERVLDIYERENPDGVILSMGGQIPNNLATKLFDAGVLIYGTHPSSIDMAEDRNKFSALLDSLNIQQPEWAELTGIDEAKIFAEKVGYPVLIRPSYVLSGAAMNVAWDDASLEQFLGMAAEVSAEYPVVISKFMENSKEIEIDAVAKRGKIIYDAITEHVENAGVHSGDATVVLPAQRLYIETIRKIRLISGEIAKVLNITGPFNIQFLAKSNHVRVIECNLRASRSFPFCSKISRVNMINLAVRAMLDEELPAKLPSALDLPWVGVKAAQFSYGRLHGADPISGVEMASTGEVGCIGSELSDAYLKATLSVGYKIPRKGSKILLSTGSLEEKLDFLASAKLLVDMGFELYASIGTARFLSQNGVPVTHLAWPLEKKEPNMAEYIKNGDFSLIINIPKNNGEKELKNDFVVRRMAVDFGIPLFTNIKAAREFIDAIQYEREKGLEIKAWEDYC